jgi:nitroreductase
VPSAGRSIRLSFMPPPATSPHYLLGSITTQPNATSLCEGSRGLALQRSLLQHTARIGPQPHLCASASQPSLSAMTLEYRERGRGFVYLEAGHYLETGRAAENVMLQAVALDLATTMVGAFNDDEVGAFWDSTRI